MRLRRGRRPAAPPPRRPRESNSRPSSPSSKQIALPVPACNGFIPGTLKAVGPEAESRRDRRLRRHGPPPGRPGGRQDHRLGKRRIAEDPGRILPRPGRGAVPRARGRIAPLAARADVVLALEPLQSSRDEFHQHPSGGRGDRRGRRPSLVPAPGRPLPHDARGRDAANPSTDTAAHPPLPRRRKGQAHPARDRGGRFQAVPQSPEREPATGDGCPWNADGRIWPGKPRAPSPRSASRSKRAPSERRKGGGHDDHAQTIPGFRRGRDGRARRRFRPRRHDGPELPKDPRRQRPRPGRDRRLLRPLPERSPPLLPPEQQGAQLRDRRRLRPLEPPPRGGRRLPEGQGGRGRRPWPATTRSSTSGRTSTR